MKVKKLEKRIKEITCNNDFELKIKDIYYPIENIYEIYITKLARLNDAEDEALFLNNEYAEDFKSKSDSIIYKMVCDNLDYVIEKERKETKIIVLELIKEVFINQDLYNILESEMPNLNKIVSYIYKSKRTNNFLDNIIDWLDDWCDEIEQEDVEELYIFSLIDYKFGEYYEYKILPEINENREDK